MGIVNVYQVWGDLKMESEYNVITTEIDTSKYCLKLCINYIHG